MRDHTLIIVAIIAATAVIIFVFKRSCPMVQGCPSCPTVSSSQYANTPVGLCLLDCDQYSDVYYRNCNKDEECIRRCYEIKTKCYMDCLKLEEN